MSQPFPVGIFSALVLCLVFVLGLVRYSRKHKEIPRRLQVAISVAFCSVPLLGLVYVAIQILITKR